MKELSPADYLLSSNGVFVGLFHSDLGSYAWVLSQLEKMEKNPIDYCFVDINQAYLEIYHKKILSAGILKLEIKERGRKLREMSDGNNVIFTAI